jgi:quinol monooxygenase YgiN
MVTCLSARARAIHATATGRRPVERVHMEGEMLMIHVVAVITAKPAQREKILEAFRANVPAVHAEKGCIEYGAAVDADGIGSFQTKFGPDTFVVVEKWESPEALKAHAAAPHMAAYAAKTRDLIASRVIHVLSPT